MEPRGPTTDLDLPALAGDPYPLLHALRSRSPVAWAPALGRWLVTSRAAVLEVLLDPATFTTDSPRSPIRSTFGPQMLSTDGEEQRRHRAPFARPFRSRDVQAALERSVQERARRVIGRLDGGAADLAPAASAMAVGTVAEAIGLELDDPAAVRAWYEDVAAALANVDSEDEVADRGARAAAAFREAMRSRPWTGVMGEASEALDADGLDANALLIMFGGIETTESMILNAAWAILGHDVTAGAAGLPNAVEESLRWEPAVQTLTRYATSDAVLRGVTIRDGDVIECMVGAANRDPDHFPDPDAFVPDRPNARQHVTFGHGVHTCIGLHLARLETVAFLETVLSLPGVRLDPDNPCRPAGHEFRKVRPMRVVWDA